MKPLTPSPSRQQVVEDIALAHVEWREESARVWDAYDGWMTASAEDHLCAHAAYRAALDREEAAANVYAKLTEDVHGRVDAEGDLQVVQRGPD